MNEIYEVVRTAIKSKIPAQKTVNGEVVKTNRDEILDGVPFQVKRAILKLQEDEVIPPKLLSVNPVDAKQTYVDKTGKGVFSYIKLPEKFAGLHDFQVGNISEDWFRYDNEFLIEKMSSLRNRNLYKVLKLDLSETGEHQDVLVMAPFPETTEMIFIKYFISGSEEFIDLIDEQYWNVIISKVEQLVGIGSKMQAEEDAYDVSRKWADTQKTGENATTRPSFFGRTSPKYRRKI